MLKLDRVICVLNGKIHWGTWRHWFSCLWVVPKQIPLDLFDYYCLLDMPEGFDHIPVLSMMPYVWVHSETVLHRLCSRPRPRTEICFCYFFRRRMKRWRSPQERLGRVSVPDFQESPELSIEDRDENSKILIRANTQTIEVATSLNSKYDPSCVELFKGFGPKSRLSSCDCKLRT